MSCAVGILLLASACSRANEPQLEVVHRILDVAPQPAAGDAVGWCELESEVRPAIGCLPKFPGSIAKLEVADSPLRRRLAVPEAARGGPILVESRLVFAGGGRPTFLPAFVVREPAGETIDVELTIPSAAPKKSARLEYRLRPLPPAVREYASAEIDVPRGAVLEVGVAVDPLARRVERAPCEMEIVARRGSSERRLFRTLLAPGGAGVGRWRDQRIDLAPVAGDRVHLVFRSRVVAPPGGEIDVAYGFPIWGTANVLAPASRARPNVILVSLDTLRADHLGGYGSALETSPEIDRFAGEATLFELAYATWTSTLQSHMSLFTGRYVAGYGDISLTRALSPGIPTLPELLAGAGYATAAVTEDAILRRALGFGRGVDSYRENRSTGPHAAPGHAEQTFATGLRWLKRHRDERFFLFLHTYQVHSPYTPPPAFDRFRTWNDRGVERPIDADTPPGVRDERLYAGEVRYTDAEVGKLLAGIAALGVSESTIVVVAADHGEEFGEHGLSGHGKALFRESAHVPLIVRAPGIAPPGLRVPVQVSLVDVLPTLLELTGIEPPHRISGRSLVPLLADPSSPAFADRPVFSEVQSVFGDLFAVRDRTHTWIFAGRQTPRIVAYDRRLDRDEHVAVRDSGLLERGRRFRDAFDAEVAAIRPVDAARDRALQVDSPDPATARKLRALGYVE
ncbi:MAG TPA: sulfatase [Candidatus Binatia bacterium]|nr:sulfatase [Candidatus Binatia bacterium]